MKKLLTLLALLALTACGGSEVVTPDPTPVEEPAYNERQVEGVHINVNGVDYGGVLAYCDGTTRIYQTPDTLAAVPTSPECVQ